MIQSARLRMQTLDRAGVSINQSLASSQLFNFILAHQKGSTRVKYLYYVIDSGQQSRQVDRVDKKELLLLKDKY